MKAMQTSGLALKSHVVLRLQVARNATAEANDLRSALQSAQACARAADNDRRVAEEQAAAMKDAATPVTTLPPDESDAVAMQEVCA